MTKPAPLPEMVERVARALNPIAWKYLDHQDDDNARKRRRTNSIRQARNVLKELRQWSSAMEREIDAALGEVDSPADNV